MEGEGSGRGSKIFQKSTFFDKNRNYFQKSLKRPRKFGVPITRILAAGFQSVLPDVAIYRQIRDMGSRTGDTLPNAKNPRYETILGKRAIIR